MTAATLATPPGRASDRAGEAAPDLGAAWLRAMRGGDFASAWTISDAVLRGRRGVDCSSWPRHRQFIWDGTPLRGRRVLIRCYHGLGDTVQFIRYAPLVRALAREVAVWAQPKLLPLLALVPGIDRLLALHDETPGVDYDVDVEVMELPHVFRSTVADLPAAVPYIRMERRVPPRQPGRPLDVGVVWSAGEWDPARNLPSVHLRAWQAIPGVRLHALQFGPPLRDWSGPAGAVRGGDPLATARAMLELDLIVSVDSFPAHLAGALGVPVWTLLPCVADWRWLDRTTRSPWYPTMRLFRQPAPGAWDAPVTAIGAALNAATNMGPTL